MYCAHVQWSYIQKYNTQDKNNSFKLGLVNIFWHRSRSGTSTFLIMDLYMNKNLQESTGQVSLVNDHFAYPSKIDFPSV